MGERQDRLRGIAIRIFTFLAGQGCVQLLSAVIGISMVRVLSKQEFAVFSLTFGLQVTIGSLSDLGFNGAILALAGPRYEDKAVLGEYIKAASVVRRVLVSILSIFALAAVIGFHKLPSLPLTEVISLCAAIIVTLQFQAWASYYEAPLLLRNKLKQFYAPQIAGQLLRIGGLFVLYAFHRVTVEGVIWINTANVVLMGVSYRMMSRQWVEVPSKAPAHRTKEMLRYLMPLLPGIIYQALQGQITVFLAALFGKVDQVAEVAAVGRLGQLFIVLSMSNSVLIGPMFARMSKSLFVKRYFMVMGVITLVAAVIFASGYLRPTFYLLILGPKYQGVSKSIRLVVQAAAISYLAGSMWAIAASRKWIFWWSGTIQLCLLTLIQFVAALFTKLDSAEGVLRLTVYVACGNLFIQIAHAIKGMFEWRKVKGVGI
jgi:O-antigen/teichoic acid export membrane protein